MIVSQTNAGIVTRDMIDRLLAIAWAQTGRELEVVMHPMTPVIARDNFTDVRLDAECPYGEVRVQEVTR
jgi:hypothetical protein